MQEENREIWIRSGKRSFQMMEEEVKHMKRHKDTVHIYHCIDEDGVIDLPMLSQVSEEVWRALFPTPANKKSISFYIELFRAAVYLGASLRNLDTYWESLAKLLWKQPECIKPWLQVLDQFHMLFADAYKRERYFVVYLAKAYCRKNDEGLPYLPLQDISSDDLSPKLHFYLQHFVSWHFRTRYYGRMQIPPACRLLDFFELWKERNHLQDLKFLDDDSWFDQIFTSTAVRNVTNLEDFQQRFDRFSYGICQSAAIRRLLKEGKMAFAGGSIAHCLEHGELIPGKDVDIFTFHDHLQEVLNALEAFRDEFFPGKRLYFVEHSSNVVNVQMDDVPVIFQVISMWSTDNFQDLLLNFDINTRMLLYDGERVWTTYDGLQGWFTNRSYILPSRKFDYDRAPYNIHKRYHKLCMDGFQTIYVYHNHSRELRFAPPKGEDDALFFIPSSNETEEQNILHLKFGDRIVSCSVTDYMKRLDMPKFKYVSKRFPSCAVPVNVEQTHNDEI